MNNEPFNPDTAGAYQPPPQTPPPYTPPPAVARYPNPPARPKRSIWRVFWWFFFVVSILVNLGLFLGLIGMTAFFAVGSQGSAFTENVIQSGDRSDKIVVVNLMGMIDGQQAVKIRTQIEMARKDETVKGMILRVNSPGGTVSASDQIYNELMMYRQDTGKPVLAFMQGVAASGGYYASAGCDHIMAEPTVITGSIGVIMSHFVFEDLLKNKLGVIPVVVKSGEKKDWPSSFKEPSEEELQYLQDRLVQPAYERFLGIVVDSRKDHLSADQVRSLADGSIYSAEEAHDNMLIDRVGYLNEAIAFMETMASTSDAHVVEYREPFSFRDIMGVQSKDTLLSLDRKTLHELGTPEILYLWKAY
jgi:protease IV